MNNNNNNNTSHSTTVYLGNTRTISNDSLRDYCSKFGLIVDCSRRLSSSEQSDLVDFTFVQFLNAQSTRAFLSTPSHTLPNGIVLDVRPFEEILHSAVPLSVDRKICLRNLPSHISLSDVKKYLRTFGAIQQVTSESNENEGKRLYIEFQSTASRLKLLKGKIKHHRLREHVLDIVPLLRPTDVDLYKNVESVSMSMDDPSTLIYFEREYRLNIREQFERIDYQIADLVKEKRQTYERLRQMIE